MIADLLRRRAATRSRWLELPVGEIGRGWCVGEDRTSPTMVISSDRAIDPPGRPRGRVIRDCAYGAGHYVGLVEDVVSGVERLPGLI